MQSLFVEGQFYATPGGFYAQKAVYYRLSSRRYKPMKTDCQLLPAKCNQLPEAETAHFEMVPHGATPGSDRDYPA